MIIHTMPQQSEEWFDVKLGKLGSTTLGTLLVDGKSASGLGAGALTNLYRIAGEIITGESESDFTGSRATERGNDLEPFARKYYEDATFTKVHEVGFVEMSDFVGCSPDGLIDDAGLIEIKCLNAREFVKASVQGNKYKIDTAHIKQMQAQMFVTGRKWCDYVLFHPSFKNPMIKTRVMRDEAIMHKYETRTKVFINELEKLVEKLAA